MMGKGKCNHLKDGHHFYLKVVKSYFQYCTPDGVPYDAEEVPGNIRGGTVAYCANCGRPIGRVKHVRNRYMVVNDGQD